MSSGYDVLMPLAPWESAEVLAQALESLHCQTMPADSVVVSTDGLLPADLHRLLTDCVLPLKLIEGPGGEGVGPVLARGLLACEQEFVIRADADDLSLPDRCFEQVTRMQAEPHLAVLSGPIAEFEHDPQQWLSVRAVPTESDAIYRSRTWRNPMNHPAVILRRSAVLAVGSYRRKPGFEDYDLWLRLLDRFGALCLANSEHVLVLARIGPAHLSRRRGWRYACAEVSFYVSSCCEGLLSPWSAFCAIAVRIPWRVLPAPVLGFLMRVLRRSTSL
jgi:hypothetical protein